MLATNDKKQSKLFIFVWCAAAALMLGTCSYRFVSPTARDGRATFNNLVHQNIRSITIEPTKYESVVTSPVVIQDSQTIERFANALSGLSTHLENHPKITRTAVIRIRLQDREIGGELRESSNDGTSFYYYSDVNSGWIFAVYQVPNNRRVFDLIEHALSQSAAPNNSFKPTPLRGVGKVP